jgi:hypothetical protein
VSQVNVTKLIVSVHGPTPLGQADLVDRLVANAGKAPWIQWILQAHDDGTLEPFLGQLDYTILSTLKMNGFEDTSIVTDAWLNAYRTHSRHRLKLPVRWDGLRDLRPGRIGLRSQTQRPDKRLVRNRCLRISVKKIKRCTQYTSSHYSGRLFRTVELNAYRASVTTAPKTRGMK